MIMVVPPMAGNAEWVWGSSSLPTPKSFDSNLAWLSFVEESLNGTNYAYGIGESMWSASCSQVKRSWPGLLIFSLGLNEMAKHSHTQPHIELKSSLIIHCLDMLCSRIEAAREVESQQGRSKNPMFLGQHCPRAIESPHLLRPKCRIQAFRELELASCLLRMTFPACSRHCSRPCSFRLIRWGDDFGPVPSWAKEKGGWKEGKTAETAGLNRACCSTVADSSM